jgi:hypothetical protein
MVRKLLFEKKREDMTKDSVQGSDIVEGALMDKENQRGRQTGLIS